MNRLRQWSVLICLCVAAAMLFAPLRGQAPPVEKIAGDKPAEKWLVDRALVLTPAPAPVPVLKYRLYPTFLERKEGNAVPIYERFAHDRSEERKNQLSLKPDEWNKLPLDKLPLDEVKKFLDSYKYNFRQLELGARRRTADWGYTLDTGDLIGVLLPDAQEMRRQAPLLVLKARVEIAERRYADAVRTLETGFSFARQVGESPFLISNLVAIAIAGQVADCLLDLIEAPDAPNLYWALTVLPRPLIDMRHANEFEQGFLELQFPDMAELDRPRAPEEWDAVLKRVRLEIERLGKMEGGDTPPLGNGSNDPAGISPDLPEACRYLAKVVGMKTKTIDAMPPAQVLLVYLSHYYHEFRDDVFKSTYLPYPQGRPLAERAQARLKAPVAATIGGWMVRALLPALSKIQLAQVRNERKIAALRVIEALRMHAAAHGGAWPDKLDRVKVAPVPNDPGTGQPFEYQRDGQTATLTSRIPGEPLAATGLRYRVTIRK